MNVGELLIRIGADTGGVRRGVAETRREIASLPEEHVIHIRVDNGGGGIGGMSRNLSGIQTKMKAIAALAPIIADGLTVSVGALGGLVSMLGAATVGATGFAAVAISTLNDVFEAQKNIEKANQDIAKASTEAERATAVENLAQAYKGLNSGQLLALNSLQKFRSFWSDFTASFNNPVVVAFSRALDGLRFVLENIKPAIMATANATAAFFGKMNEAMKNSDFRRFFDWLGGSVGGTLSTFGEIFINTMQGIANIMVAFQPVSNAMQGGLKGMTESFLRWSQGLKDSESFKRFLDLVIGGAPAFLGFFKQLSILLMDVIRPLSWIGEKALYVGQAILALFNAFNAFNLGTGNATARLHDFMNAIRGLLGLQKKAFTPTPIQDVNDAYKDMFSNVGSVTDGLKDAKKASDGFLASFDEVHNIPDFGGVSGSTTPTIPTSGGTTSGGGSPAVVDNTDVQQSDSWLQKLIDKIKQIPPLIPLKFDPPDAGGGAVAIGLGLVTAALGVLTGNMGLARQGWSTMTQGFQLDLTTYLPSILSGIGFLGLSLVGLSPVMSLTHINWHGMLDAMQSKLNAYRPYLEYGLALLGIGLGDLQTAQLLLETNWGKSWQNMYANQLIQSNKMIKSFEAVQAAFVAMQQTIGQPVTAPSMQTHLAGGNQPIMDDLISSSPVTTTAPATSGIGDFLKGLGAGYIKLMDSLRIQWLTDHPEIGSGVGLGGATSGAVSGLESLSAGALEKLMKLWQSLQGSGLGGAVTGFAGGGVIGSDSIVRVGEQGRREAIIPLESNAMQPFANAIASSMGGGGGSNGGDIILQIEGTELARIIAPYGLKESSRIGGSMITSTT